MKRLKHSEIDSKYGISIIKQGYNNNTNDILGSLSDSLLNTERPPFNSSIERDCIKKQRKKGVVGPGSYIDINNPKNSCFANTLMKLKSDKNFA